MLHTRSAGALIPGAPQTQEKAKMKVKVLSGFMYQGKLVEAGTEIEVDEALGNEVVGSNKAVSLEPPTPRVHNVPGNEMHYEDWTIEDMMTYLRTKKVIYPHDADRPALEALCRNHDKEANAAAIAAATKKPEAAVAADSTKFDGWTNDELRSYLDKKKVYYPSSADKAALVELAKTA